ncbi:leishmanolysin-like peptidase [Achlya hypogyna]|uniref:Leishmanolysin-like peptidase n=1 Tax=Achlya hypogyna TaxID=1202772 RepID=A0A1V9Z1A9_ACHHY|nr:leishmanolysin-like peptidase [Achlya hypogyna]
MRVSGAVLVAASTALGCVHDEVLSQVQHVTSPQGYARHHDRLVHSDRRLDGSVGADSATKSSFQPLRLATYFDNVTIGALSSANQIFLTQYLVPAAVAYWQRALSVVPVVGGLLATHTCTATSVTATCLAVTANQLCVDMPIPDAHFAPIMVCPPGGSCSVVSPNNTPINNADMLLYVRAATTTNCATNVLAYAATCQRDQFDRPIFGMINFCPGYINPSQRAGPIFNQQLTTAMHEMAHALGLSAASFPLMRQADGTPRTPRASGGLHGSTVPMAGVCNGATTPTVSTVFPSNNTIIYRTLRGRSVATVVTPAVVRFTQAYFNCSTVPGADLENNDPACLGSHWEERLFSPESMSPVINYNGNAFTALTLAFFEDSGWYQPNYSMAQPMYYGNNQGCAFTTDPRGRIARELWRRRRYRCGTMRMTVVGYTGGDCSFSINELTLTASSVPALGEVYGTQSKCAMTTLRQNNMKGLTVTNRYAGCYAMSCNMLTTPPTVRISVAQSATTSVTVSCTVKGQVLAVPGFTGTLVCPDPFIVCGLAVCTPPCADDTMCVNGVCISTTPSVTPVPTFTPAPTTTSLASSTAATSDPEPSTTIAPTGIPEPAPSGMTLESPTAAPTNELTNAPTTVSEPMPPSSTDVTTSPVSEPTPHPFQTTVSLPT